jgi:hypothetical protein
MNKHTSTCLQKAGDDEPIFVLRAQDKLAPEIVHLWVNVAKIVGVNPTKIAEAEQIALAMARWPKRKLPD